MKIYSLPTLVNIARARTSYYKELYKNISDQNLTLAKLPPVDLDSYWRYDPIEMSDYIFTDHMHDGFIFASSGSTGLPKYTAFSKQEWNCFSQIMGQLMWKSKLIENGDIVANLASVGNLLSSFLTVHDGLLSSIASCVELPISISSSTTSQEIVEVCSYLKANVLIGLSFNLVDIAYYVKKNQINDLKLNKIIYGGEALLKPQFELIQEAFPGAIITPCIYSSNDAGLIGYWDEACRYNELRSCDPYAKIEIIDEYTKESISEPFIEGIVLATNFTKILMPTIRYPVGDKGMWTEVANSEANRKYILTDRLKKTEIKIDEVNISARDFTNILNKFPRELSICRFQLDISLKDKKDFLTLKLGYHQPKQLTNAHLGLIEDTIYAEIPQLFGLVNEKKIHPVYIECIELDQIKANVGPGKHRTIIDHRAPQIKVNSYG